MIFIQIEINYKTKKKREEFRNKPQSQSLLSSLLWKISYFYEAQNRRRKMFNKKFFQQLSLLTIFCLFLSL